MTDSRSTSSCQQSFFAGKAAVVTLLGAVIAGTVIVAQPRAGSEAQAGSQGVQREPQPPVAAGQLGYTDTPRLPELPWHVHDPKRPQPMRVTAQPVYGAAPSDAIVLFDGKDLSKWVHRRDSGEPLDAKWSVRDGYFEVAPRAGTLSTRDSFGDVQLHVEWAAPEAVKGESQGRGNSGVFLMGLYEVQVLDSYENPTYADGMAGAIYGQWPPLVNAARKPGEWQTYDIVFEAPRFEEGKVVRPAVLTVFWNGVVVQNRRELIGRTVHRDVGRYTAHAAELPLTLQDHGDLVRFRNIWIRRLTQPETPETR